MLNYKIIFIAFSFAVVCTSCKDWTEVRSIDLKEADIEKDNPGLYAKYLGNLRDYKKSDHKLFYAWFNNIIDDMPRTRGQHIDALPDSVDIVNLMNPAELPSWLVSEMKDVREKKGTRFIFTVSYIVLEKEYERYVGQKEAEKSGTETEPVEIMEFVDYAEEFVGRHLSLVNAYDYDGISVYFQGMITTHLTEEQKAAYLAREASFMSPIAAWVNGNPDKVFIFEGYPQNLTDKSILQRAEFIGVRSESLNYASGLNYEVLQMIADGVPTDRFVITVNAHSLDPADTKTGYYIDTDKKMVSCIPVAAEWVVTPDARFTKAGLAVLNVQNDYYNLGRSYKNIREAIAAMSL